MIATITKISFSFFSKVLVKTYIFLLYNMFSYLSKVCHDAVSPSRHTLLSHCVLGAISKPLHRKPKTILTPPKAGYHGIVER